LTSTSKGTKPVEVAQDGTLYRVIRAITQGQSRESYLKTTKIRSKNYLDIESVAHVDQWKNICKIHNDVNSPELKNIDEKNKLLIASNTPQKFDVLDEKSMYATVQYMNFYYNKMRNNKNRSGNNNNDKSMQKFCAGKVWLLFYHHKLCERGNKDLMDCMYAQLPKEVFYTLTSLTSDLSISSVNKRSSGKEKYPIRVAMEGENVEIKKIVQYNLRKDQRKDFETLIDDIFLVEKEYSNLNSEPSKIRRGNI